MKALLILVFLVCHGSCLQKYAFNTSIENFVVGNDGIYVSTEGHLYQLNRDLLVETGKMTGEPGSLKMLVVFEKNDTLITCLAKKCSYCELLDLKNISRTIHSEEVAITPIGREGSGLGFLIDVGSGAYLVAGVFQRSTTDIDCPQQNELVTLRNTLETQHGGIFSKIDKNGESSLNLRNESLVVHFVDGFQRGFQVNLFLNIQHEAPLVRLLWMQNKAEKFATLNSVRSVTLWCCSDKARTELVSSADMGSSSTGWWAGVFTAGNVSDPENTALAVFNITQARNGANSEDPYFCVSCRKDVKPENMKRLNPSAVVFTHPSMTALTAVSIQSWVVLLVGTADGQLIKISLDETLKPTCPAVLYQSENHLPVLRMILDPVEKKHVYMAMGKQLMAVSLDQCGSYTHRNSCLSAQDPLCVWCVSDERSLATSQPSRCTFHNECRGSNLIPINKTFEQSRVAPFSVTRPSPEEPEIDSIIPASVSFYGKNNVKVSGKNLGNVTKMYIIENENCDPKESLVLNHTSDSLMFHLPRGNKGFVTVCAALPNGKCFGLNRVRYGSLPLCEALSPNTSWISGGRRITVLGENLEFVDGIHHNEMNRPLGFNFTSRVLKYYSPQHKESVAFVSLRVVNNTLPCKELTYLPDPQFTSFKTTPTGNNLRITIAKRFDMLNINMTELNISAMEGEKEHVCVPVEIEVGSKAGEDSVVCEIDNQARAKIQSLKISVGKLIVELQEQNNNLFIILIVLPFIPLIILVCVYRVKQRKLSEQMNKRLEMLECDIRNEIRQGFVDMQTETSALIENVGAVPFLDYKHFASRIFFPEAGLGAKCYIRDIDQDAVKAEPDESCQALAHLLRDKLFITTFIHTLEEQKNFNVKDKCTVASLLTVALHTDLPYLTEVMEDLLRTLMEQSSNAQPKLMLRRTESIVEKLLTNWMSVCLYGFLRECVGQPLYLLVCALSQQSSKGPVDWVTGKALYTLNEDWLLWQAQDFKTLTLKVSFSVALGEENKSLDVAVLDCDSVEQVKEKIFAAFNSKFGFAYSKQPGEVDLEYVKEGGSQMLHEVDSTSEVVGEVTLLNTLKHFKVPEGASIKVVTKKTLPTLSPQVSLKDDQNFATKYFHLIDPDIDDHKDQNPERKKLKLKEIHLTKLLSTKVAVHSFVESLFRTVWGTANNRVSPAIKHFFDFLDSQAEIKKITDPDVLHIWKTNSLPLRFWVNIIKNPQFVFDMEKTPHLDGCLSVIAQAFMDSFSLAEQHLGKHAPTNKLLYAKDIPHYKQEVKTYYQLVRDMPELQSQEFNDFLQQEAKKHEHEFNEAAALREIYTYVKRYYGKLLEKLDQNSSSSKLKQEVQKVTELFENLKSCTWD